MKCLGIIAYATLLLAPSTLLVAGAGLPGPLSTNWGDVIFGMLPETLQKVFSSGSREEGQKILSEADRLVLEAPRQGFVAAGQSAVLKLSLPTSGGVFPNVLLTLSTTNKDGDADLYCVPPPHFNYVNMSPGPDIYVWKSHHSHGEDIVFISKSHEAYDSSKAGVEDDKITATRVEFICSVVGFAAGGTEYVVEVEVDYMDRTLVAEERKVVQEIFESCCDGKPGVCESWMSTGLDSDVVDICHVPGNVCNSDGRLIKLDLGGMGLKCGFPAHALKELQFIRTLNLANNHLQGDINHLISEIPKLENKLQHLDVSDNLLTGDLMDEATSWCGLTHSTSGLVVLNVARNNLEGAIPGCLLDKDSKLIEFTYDGNILLGDLPYIPKDSAVQGLSLSDTGLAGTIPYFLSQLESLVELDLSDNALEGTIPEEMGVKPSLRFLDLHSNKLDGLVPHGIPTSSSLEVVNLESNHLLGFSEEWYDANSMESSTLRQLQLANNNLQGPFPTALVAATSLNALDIRENQISGFLPDVSDMMPSVVVFLAGGNRFEGSIPVYWGGMSFFSKKALTASPYEPTLDLSRNLLSGQIPSFMYIENVPISMWNHIHLGGNKFDLQCPLKHYLIHIDLGCDKSVALAPEENAIIVKDSIHKYLPRTVIKIADFVPEAENPGSDTEFIESKLQSLERGSNDERSKQKIEGLDGHSSSSGSSTNATILGLIVAGVLGGSILSGILGMFVYRWHKRYKWDKAVDAALVKDLELGPKINQVNGAFMICPGTPEGVDSM